VVEIVVPPLRSGRGRAAARAPSGAVRARRAGPLLALSRATESAAAARLAGQRARAAQRDGTWRSSGPRRSSAEALPERTAPTAPPRPRIGGDWTLEEIERGTSSRCSRARAGRGGASAIDPSTLWRRRKKREEG
jgi:hypothetical protein